jgi:hypothetical protein
VLLAAFGFLVLLAGAIGILYAIYATSGAVSQKLPAPKVFPAPRSEPDPAAELHRLFAQQRQALSSYRWLNAEHTLVAIPIDRAMDLIAQRGDKAFAPIATVASASAPQTQQPVPPPRTPSAVPAGQVTTPLQPQARKVAPTPPSRNPALGTGAQSGSKR